MAAYLFLVEILFGRFCHRLTADHSCIDAVVFLQPALYPSILGQVAIGVPYSDPCFGKLFLDPLIQRIP